jgi:spectinomycin phosphotransferase
MEHQATIHTMITSMESLAGVLRKQSGPHVICHADLHPANIIRDRAGNVFIIDWDDVMLAPKERDFIFTGQVTVDGSTLQESLPFISFFQGYGQTETDWLALTYYLWERVVQDLIACAQDVFLREDLEEATRAEAVQLFSDILAEGGELGAAKAAAAHLNTL